MVRNRFATYAYHYTLAFTYPFTFTLNFTYILRASIRNKRHEQRKERQSAAPRQFPHKPNSTGKWPYPLFMAQRSNPRDG
jgi:hypothetical protein